MISPLMIGLAGAVLCVFCASACAADTDVVSTGARFSVEKALVPGGTTVVLFVQATSAMEQQFVESLQREVNPDDRVALRLVRLKDVLAPAAQQYAVKATPTAIVYDRFGRELARTSDAGEIAAAVRKGRLMGRIKWMDEDDPRAPETYHATAEQLKRGVPGIVKTMSMTPEAFQMFNIMSEIHFSDGFLKRREHEMIAAYVSGLNKCRF